jgi:hypothetical protein
MRQGWLDFSDCHGCADLLVGIGAAGAGTVPRRSRRAPRWSTRSRHGYRSSPASACNLRPAEIDSWTLGSACTCATVPSLSTSPACSTVTEVAKDRMKCMSCSTTRTILGDDLQLLAEYAASGVDLLDCPEQRIVHRLPADRHGAGQRVQEPDFHRATGGVTTGGRRRTTRPGISDPAATASQYEPCNHEEGGRAHRTPPSCVVCS